MGAVALYVSLPIRMLFLILMMIRFSLFIVRFPLHTTLHPTSTPSTSANP